MTYVLRFPVQTEVPNLRLTWFNVMPEVDKPLFGKPDTLINLGCNDRGPVPKSLPQVVAVLLVKVWA